MIQINSVKPERILSAHEHANFLRKSRVDCCFVHQAND